MSGNLAAQKVAFGLTIDREFGGCRCSDQDEMEFGPNPAMQEDNTWRCQCLNDDLYLSQPVPEYVCRRVQDNAEVALLTAVSAGAMVAPVVPEWTSVSCNAQAGIGGGRLSVNDANGKRCGIIKRCLDEASDQQ